MAYFSRNPSLTRVALLSWLCAGLLSGLLAAKFTSWAIPWVWLAVWFVVLWRRNGWLLLFAVVSTGLAVGLWRGQTVRHDLVCINSLHGQRVVMTAHVRDDPVYDERRRLDFRVDKMRMNGQGFPGQARVRSITAHGVRRGDIVQVSGKLLPGYGNYQAGFSFANVQVIGRDSGWLEGLRRQFFSGVYNALPDPQASLGLGFLVGLRAGLPADLQEQLRAVALTHIVVASGYNLTILVRASRRLLARSSHFQAFAGSVALVAAMLAVTGLSPSMARAGLVTLISLSAWYYGRRIHPALLLLGAAAITAYINPLYAWYDLGWWLSFLAFAGVLLVAPLLSACFLAGNKSPPLLAQIALETIAAQLLVEPLILLMFGQFAVLGLVANLTIVPLVPIAMVATFAAGLAGLWVPELAGWMAVPANLCLSYIVQMVNLLAGPSWAVQHVPLTAISVGVWYATIVVGGVLLYRRLGFRYRQCVSVVE